MHDDDDTFEDVEELLREVRRRRSSGRAPSSGREADGKEPAGEPDPAELGDDETIALAGDVTIVAGPPRSGIDPSAESAPSSTRASLPVGDTPRGRAMLHRVPPLARAALGLLTAAVVVAVAFAAGWRPFSGDVTTDRDPAAVSASERDRENTTGDTDRGTNSTPTSDYSNGDDTSGSTDDSYEPPPEVAEDNNDSIAESADGEGIDEGRFADAAPEPVAAPELDPYRLAFVSNWEGEQAIYYVDFVAHMDEIEILGGWPRITYSEREEGSPSWSPDGSWIVFQRQAEEGAYWQLFIKNVEADRELQMLCGSHNGWSPDWSPDGTRIAFARGNENENDLLYLDVATLEQDTMKDKAGETDRRPRWSPDGNQIAFVRGSFPERRVWVLHVHSQDRNIDEIAIGDGDYSAPDWSPVSNTLAFAVRPRESDYRHIYTADLRIQNPYGNDPEVILSNPLQITSEAYKDDEPTWSPDGEWIAFTREDQGNRGIYIVNASGGEPQALAALTGFDYWAPSWAPNGTMEIDPTFSCD